MFHIICIFIVLLLRTNPYPKEVLWLLPFINYLGDNLVNQFDKIHIQKLKYLLTQFFYTYISVLFKENSLSSTFTVSLH